MRKNALSLAMLFTIAVYCACQPPDNSFKPEKAPTAQAHEQRTMILTKNRRFMYAVRWTSSTATTVTLDTLVLLASGTPWKVDSTQTGFDWLFTEDTTLTSRPVERVGAIETPERFWLHPPRYRRYRILELNPFPEMRTSSQQNYAWRGEVYAPSYYADSAWATWSGVLHVWYKYTLAGVVVLDTPLGRLPSSRVYATGTSKLGTTYLESYFHPAYGFLRLKYRNVNQSQVELNLVAVDVQAPSVKEMLGKAFQQQL